MRLLASGPRRWAALAGVLGVLALAAQAVPAVAWEWQAARWPHEPWRAFTAAAVHYSGLHLAANLVGTLLVGAFGVVAQVPPRCTAARPRPRPPCSAAAWAAAWPLTQLGLLAEPALARFGGLSGVLHAGVAVVALHLVHVGQGRRRIVGGAVLAGLVLKVLGESPWGAPLRAVAGWDILLAPLAHASGSVAGLVCALVAEALAQRVVPRPEPHR